MTRPPAPYPWRPSAATLDVDETFADWASKDWVLRYTNEDTVLVKGTGAANGFDDGTNADLSIADEVLFTWFDADGDPDNVPFLQDAYVERTFAGFAPGALEMLRVGYRWTLGVGFPGGPGDDGGDMFFGIEVNGTRLGPAGPIFFGDGTGTLAMFATADEDGEIVVRAGIWGVHPSFNINAGFTTLTIGPPNTVQRYIVDTAGMWANGYPISITRGGFAFAENPVYEPYDYPGRVGTVEGMEELVSIRPTLTGTFMFVGEYELTLYRPGGTWGDHASISGARTYTMDAMRAALSTGTLMSNVIAVWRLSDGWYFGVEFPRAIGRSYGVHSADKNEGEIAVEIEALWAAGASRRSVPYLLHLYPPETEF